LDKIAMLEVDREIVIQYGRGTCPAQFFPSEIGRAVDGGTFDDEGFISMRFLNDSQGAVNHFILLIRWYRFKPSLKNDMERANLILCHAGAGTLLEALSLSHPSDTTSSTHRVINAVINTELMDNHQSELAEELEKRNHILVTKDVDEWATLRGAESFWKGVNDFVPSPFFGGSSRIDSASGEGRVSNFQQIVDRVIGI
jgi:UDP-N-acetylglucosamine transferase subunit ALG13